MAIHGVMWLVPGTPVSAASSYAAQARPQTIEISLQPIMPQTLPQTPPLTKPIVRPDAAKKPVAVTQQALVAMAAESVTESITPVVETQNFETISAQTVAPRYDAKYLNNPPPAYPLAARRRNIEGTVWIRAEIQPDGSCSQVELKTASTSGLLDQAALEAVKKWRFVPATLGSETLVAWVEIPITFKLNN